MKKTSTKKVLICLSILFLLGTFIVSAVSIDPGKFVATMRIQQINLYYRIAARDNSEYEKDDIVKAGMTNYLGINKGSLYIRPVDYTGNLVDETNNVVTNPDYASIIGGQMNINDGDETTLILGGSKNTVGGHGVVLMGGDGNTATVDNAVILGSASSTVGSVNGVVMAANGGNVYGNNSTMFGGGGLISTGADNSFAIGGGVTIIHQGVFSYGSTSSVKPNIAQFNGGKGIMVGWRKPNGNSNIQLSVNGALAVGRGICDTNMRGSIYYKPGKKRNGEPAYCLCACVDNNGQGKAIALSNQPYCNSLCECQSENPDDCVMGLPECGTRGFSGVAMNYAAGEKGWRVASKFCADNRSPIEYWVYQGDSESATQYKKCDYSSSECDPPFPGLGQRVVWSCPSVGHYSEVDKVKCSAYRNIDPPELAECGENVRRYKYAETGFQSTDESGFCKRLNSNPTDYAHNGKVTAYKKLTRTQVEHGIKSGFKFEYITGDISGLLGNFPGIGERTYWKCETTNAMGEIEGQETVNEKECYADHLYCNHCAKDGFPYCFDVKFDEDCDCKDPELCPVPCVPSTDKAGDYYINVSWNDTEASDDLHSNHNNTSITSNNSELTASIDGQKVVYNFGKNEDSTARTFTATITTDDHSFCSTGIVTIYQCAKGRYWDEALAKCAPAKCLGKVPPGAVPGNNNTLLEPAEIFLTGTVSGLAKDCAYKCAGENEPYTDSKGQYHSEAHDALHLIRAGDSLFCAMCEKGTYDPELMMCVINDPAFCFEPYEWFWYDEFHSEGQCVLPGKCDDDTYENANESREDLTPPAGITSEDILQGYCVSDSEIAKQHLHECVYTCKAGTICDPVAQQCVTPSCDDYPYSFKGQELIDYLDKGEAWYDAYTDVYNPDRGRILQDYAAYSNFYKPISNTNLNNRYRDLNPELKKEYTNVTYYINGNVNGLVKREKNPTLLNQKWFFVQASSTGDFESKISGLDGCFAWCTGSTYRLDELDDEGNKYRQFSCGYKKPPTIDPGIGGGGVGDGDGDGSSCNYKDLCSGELPGGKSYGYTFQYGCDDEYGDGYPLDWSQVADENAANNQPCKYWCLPEYKITEKGGKKYCYKECKEGEYAAGYLCQPCPEGSSPNEDDKDAFGQPKSCWRQCSDTEYAGSNGNCYRCGLGQKGDPASKDSHGNATKCANICPSDETFWTVEEGKSDCGRDENNQIRRNCCLKRFALGNTRCDLNPKPDECNRVGQICVCATNLTSV